MRYCTLCALLLTACVATPVLEVRTGTWSNQCYRDFEKDVSEIAGVSATDCGFLPLNASKAERAATESCAKNAVRAAGSFKFGYQSFGDDSGYCDVAIRGQDGQLIAYFFDSDITGQMGQSGGRSTVWTSRCSKIKFTPGTIGFGSFFDLDECTEAPEIYAELSSRKEN